MKNNLIKINPEEFNLTLSKIILNSLLSALMHELYKYNKLLFNSQNEGGVKINIIRILDQFKERL
jgi:hypothetical protein